MFNAGCHWSNSSSTKYNPWQKVQNHHPWEMFIQLFYFKGRKKSELSNMTWKQNEKNKRKTNIHNQESMAVTNLYFIYSFIHSNLCPMGIFQTTFVFGVHLRYKWAEKWCPIRDCLLILAHVNFPLGFAFVFDPNGTQMRHPLWAHAHSSHTCTWV